MAKLTFLGGANEVGGNKILLESKGESIFLDFGLSYSKRAQYFSDPYLSPRSYKDLLELGILPRVDGIYLDSKGHTSIVGVILSHAHLDHCAYISFLRRDIPIYCGETAKLILSAVNNIRQGDFEVDFYDLDFKTFRTGNVLSIGNFKVYPVHVDHSIPGAYGFVIEVDGKCVVYSGDLRMHGTKAQLSHDFVDFVKRCDCDCLIIEATNLMDGECLTEEEVKDKITQLTSKVKGLVFVQFAYTDIDRLRSVYLAAKSNNRYLALTLKQAYLLSCLKEDHHLQKPDIGDSRIIIYQKQKKVYREWEESMIIWNEQVIDAHQLQKMQDKVVLISSFYDLKELIDIKPKPGSVFILASSEPVSEEAELDYQRLCNWLEHFGVPSYRIHVSGHLMPLDLRQIVAQIRPRIVIPVHCEKPKFISKYLSDLGVCVKVVGEGDSVEI